MPGKRLSEETKQYIRKLRIEDRLALEDIHRQTGISQSTLSLLLRDYPLTADEIKHRMIENGKIANTKPKGEPSKFWKLIENQTLSRPRKGKIAEAAVLFRLALHGFNVYTSPFDGDKYDCLVETPAGAFHKIQIKATQLGPHGLPYMRLTCSDGHTATRRYRAEEFDFLVGYNLFTDTAYVYSHSEIAHLNRSITISDDYAERWDKLLE